MNGKYDVKKHSHSREHHKAQQSKRPRYRKIIRRTLRSIHRHCSFFVANQKLYFKNWSLEKDSNNSQNDEKIQQATPKDESNFFSRFANSLFHEIEGGTVDVAQNISSTVDHVNYEKAPALLQNRSRSFLANVNTGRETNIRHSEGADRNNNEFTELPAQRIAKMSDTTGETRMQPITSEKSQDVQYLNANFFTNFKKNKISKAKTKYPHAPRILSSVLGAHLVGKIPKKLDNNAVDVKHVEKDIPDKTVAPRFEVLSERPTLIGSIGEQLDRKLADVQSVDREILDRKIIPSSSVLLKYSPPTSPTVLVGQELSNNLAKIDYPIAEENIINLQMSPGLQNPTMLDSSDCMKSQIGLETPAIEDGPTQVEYPVTTINSPSISNKQKSHFEIKTPIGTKSSVKQKSIFNVKSPVKEKHNVRQKSKFNTKSPIRKRGPFIVVRPKGFHIPAHVSGRKKYGLSSQNVDRSPTCIVDNPKGSVLLDAGDFQVKNDMILDVADIDRGNKTLCGEGNLSTLAVKDVGVSLACAQHENEIAILLDTPGFNDSLDQNLESGPASVTCINEKSVTGCRNLNDDINDVLSIKDYLMQTQTKAEVAVYNPMSSTAINVIKHTSEEKETHCHPTILHPQARIVEQNGKSKEGNILEDDKCVTASYANQGNLSDQRQRQSPSKGKKPEQLGPRKELLISANVKSDQSLALNKIKKDAHLLEKVLESVKEEMSVDLKGDKEHLRVLDEAVEELKTELSRDMGLLINKDNDSSTANCLPQKPRYVKGVISETCASTKDVSKHDAVDASLGTTIEAVDEKQNTSERKNMAVVLATDQNLTMALDEWDPSHKVACQHVSRALERKSTKETSSVDLKSVDQSNKLQIHESEVDSVISDYTNAETSNAAVLEPSVVGDKDNEKPLNILSTVVERKFSTDKGEDDVCKAREHFEQYEMREKLATSETNTMLEQCQIGYKGLPLGKKAKTSLAPSRVLGKLKIRETLLHPNAFLKLLNKQELKADKQTSESLDSSNILKSEPSASMHHKPCYQLGTPCDEEPLIEANIVEVFNNENEGHEHFGIRSLQELISSIPDRRSVNTKTFVNTPRIVVNKRNSISSKGTKFLGRKSDKGQIAKRRIKTVNCAFLTSMLRSTSLRDRSNFVEEVDCFNTTRTESLECKPCSMNCQECKPTSPASCDAGDFDVKTIHGQQEIAHSRTTANHVETLLNEKFLSNGISSDALDSGYEFMKLDGAIHADGEDQITMKPCSIFNNSWVDSFCEVFLPEKKEDDSTISTRTELDVEEDIECIQNVKGLHKLTSFKKKKTGKAESTFLNSVSTKGNLNKMHYTKNVKEQNKQKQISITNVIQNHNTQRNSSDKKTFAKKSKEPAVSPENCHSNPINMTKINSRQTSSKDKVEKSIELKRSRSSDIVANDRIKIRGNEKRQSLDRAKIKQMNKSKSPFTLQRKQSGSVHKDGSNMRLVSDKGKEQSSDRGKMKRMDQSKSPLTLQRNRSGSAEVVYKNGMNTGGTSYSQTRQPSEKDEVKQSETGKSKRMETSMSSPGRGRSGSPDSLNKDRSNTRGISYNKKSQSTDRSQVKQMDESKSTPSPHQQISSINSQRLSRIDSFYKSLESKKATVYQSQNSDAKKEMLLKKVRDVTKKMQERSRQYQDIAPCEEFTRERDQPSRSSTYQPKYNDPAQNRNYTTEAPNQPTHSWPEKDAVGDSHRADLPVGNSVRKDIVTERKENDNIAEDNIPDSEPKQKTKSTSDASKKNKEKPVTFKVSSVDVTKKKPPRIATGQEASKPQTNMIHVFKEYIYNYLVEWKKKNDKCYRYRHRAPPHFNMQDLQDNTIDPQSVEEQLLPCHTEPTALRTASEVSVGFEDDDIMPTLEPEVQAPSPSSHPRTPRFYDPTEHFDEDVKRALSGSPSRHQVGVNRGLEKEMEPCLEDDLGRLENASQRYEPCLLSVEDVSHCLQLQPNECDTPPPCFVDPTLLMSSENQRPCDTICPIQNVPSRELIDPELTKAVADDVLYPTFIETLSDKSLSRDLPLGDHNCEDVEPALTNSLHIKDNTLFDDEMMSHCSSEQKMQQPCLDDQLSDPLTVDAKLETAKNSIQKREASLTETDRTEASSIHEEEVLLTNPEERCDNGSEVSAPLGQVESNVETYIRLLPSVTKIEKESSSTTISTECNNTPPSTPKDEPWPTASFSHLLQQQQLSPIIRDAEKMVGVIHGSGVSLNDEPDIRSSSVDREERMHMKHSPSSYQRNGEKIIQSVLAEDFQIESYSHVAPTKSYSLPNNKTGRLIDIALSDISEIDSSFASNDTRCEGPGLTKWIMTDIQKDPSDLKVAEEVPTSMPPFEKPSLDKLYREFLEKQCNFTDGVDNQQNERHIPEVDTPATVWIRSYYSSERHLSPALTSTPPLVIGNSRPVQARKRLARIPKQSKQRRHILVRAFLPKVVEHDAKPTSSISRNLFNKNISSNKPRCDCMKPTPKRCGTSAKGANKNQHPNSDKTGQSLSQCAKRKAAVPKNPMLALQKDVRLALKLENKILRNVEMGDDDDLQTFDVCRTGCV